MFIHHLKLGSCEPSSIPNIWDSHGGSDWFTGAIVPLALITFNAYRTISYHSVRCRRILVIIKRWDRSFGLWFCECVCAAHPPSAPQTHAHTQYFWFAAARSRCSSWASRSPIRMEQCSFLAVCEPNTFLFFLWGISSLPRCVCVRESFTFCFLVIRHVLRQSSAATNRHSL